MFEYLFDFSLTNICSSVIFIVYRNKQMFSKEEMTMYIKRLNKLRDTAICLFCTLFIVLLFSFGMYHITNGSRSSVETETRRELGYKSVFITDKDTLWSIAKENYSGEYGSLNNYIKEIKRCNSLLSNRINAGSSLVVPVYVSE